MRQLKSSSIWLMWTFKDTSILKWPAMKKVQNLLVLEAGSEVVFPVDEIS